MVEEIDQQDRADGDVLGRGTRRGLKGHLRFAEGCRANPRAVSIVVLDAGRPLYLCMRKSNRRGGNGGEIRERMG